MKDSKKKKKNTIYNNNNNLLRIKVVMKHRSYHNQAALAAVLTLNQEDVDNFMNALTNLMCGVDKNTWVIKLCGYIW